MNQHEMTIIEEAQHIIGGDRKATYGDASEEFKRVAAIWSAILRVPITPKQYAMCMIGLKLARLANTADHRDSWVDVIGYAALGGELPPEVKE